MGRGNQVTRANVARTECQPSTRERLHLSICSGKEETAGGKSNCAVP